MPSDPARDALDEARVLFYAAERVFGATPEPANAVPLLKRSVLLLSRALAETAGVSSSEREDVVRAAVEIDARERLLHFPLIRTLDELDALEARFARIEPLLAPEARRSLMALVDAMPSALTSVRRYLVRTGHETRGRRGNVIAISVLLVGLVVCGLALAWRRAPSGPGLEAVYFEDRDLSRVAVRRRDPRIHFDWGSDSPAPAVPPDRFSVRWTGKLRIPEASAYTFYLASDDGARLFVADRLVVDNWSAHAMTEAQGALALPVGIVPIRVEYYEEEGIAAVTLSWSSPSRSKRIISGSAFAP